MIQYILFALETCLFFMYPLRKTYSIWKLSEIDPKGYREAVTYWIVFASLQGISWNFEKEIFSMIRIVILLAVIFKISLATRIIFKIGGAKTKLT